MIAAIQSLRRLFTKIIDKNYLRPKTMNASAKRPVFAICHNS